MLCFCSRHSYNADVLLELLLSLAISFCCYFYNPAFFSQLLPINLTAIIKMYMILSFSVMNGQHKCPQCKGHTQGTATHRLLPPTLSIFKGMLSHFWKWQIMTHYFCYGQLICTELLCRRRYCSLTNWTQNLQTKSEVQDFGAGLWSGLSGNLPQQAMKTVC